MFKKVTYLYSLVGIGAVALLVSAPHALAANLGLPVPSVTALSNNTDAITTVNTLATSVVNVIFLLAGILAVVYLLWSGVQYITAGGNADKVKAARQGIINAVIGIVVIMAAFFIIRIATSSRSVFNSGGQVNTTSSSGGGLGG